MGNGDVWVLIIILLVSFFVAIIATAGTEFWNTFLILLKSGLFIIIPLIFSGGFLISGVVISYSYPKIGKIMAYTGIIGVLSSLTFLEIFIIVITALENTGVNINDITSITSSEIRNRTLQYAMSRTLHYSNFLYCKDLPVFVGSERNITSLSDSLSCILTGYLPKSSKPILYIGFWIFNVVMPLLITAGIFNDLVESAGIIKNRLSRRLIGWGLGFMAYRGFLISGLILILDYAAAGMVTILLNFIFIGGLMSYTNRIFKQWQPLEDAIDMGRSIKIGSVNVKTILRTARDLVNRNNLDGAKSLLIASQSAFYQADPSGKLWSLVSSNLLSAQDAADFLKKLNKFKDYI
ncbi:MAG: hypothetical protein QW350_02815 [Candidatus Aenigmatarchaeota archaeon]